jgi:membrane-associated phospholipid phosphatase
VAATGAGGALLAATSRLARAELVSDREHGYFRASNELSDRIERPLASVMQFGSLGGGLATGGALYLWRGRTVGVGVAGAAFTSWALAKVVKARIGRGRPADHLDDVVIRGRPASGLGFPSGHTAVAVATATVASRQLGREWSAVLAAAALTTGVARMYVGAHLPLDVVGGAGLGLAVGSAVALVVQPRSPKALRAASRSI